jgi:hypothetical protein
MLGSAMSIMACDRSYSAAFHETCLSCDILDLDMTFAPPAPQLRAAYEAILRNGASGRYAGSTIKMLASRIVVNTTGLPFGYDVVKHVEVPEGNFRAGPCIAADYMPSPTWIYHSRPEREVLYLYGKTIPDFLYVLPYGCHINKPVYTHDNNGLPVAYEVTDVTAAGAATQNRADSGSFREALGAMYVSALRPVNAPRTYRSQTRQPNLTSQTQRGIAAYDRLVTLDPLYAEATCNPGWYTGYDYVRRLRVLYWYEIDARERPNFVEGVETLRLQRAAHYPASSAGAAGPPNAAVGIDMSWV